MFDIKFFIISIFFYLAEFRVDFYVKITTSNKDLIPLHIIQENKGDEEPNNIFTNANERSTTSFKLILFTSLLKRGDKKLSRPH